MLIPLAALAAAVAILSSSQLAHANSKVVGFTFHKRSFHHHPLQPRLHGRANTVSESITWGDLLYYINITLGTPGQASAVWLDTGSSGKHIPLFKHHGPIVEYETMPRAPTPVIETSKVTIGLEAVQKVYICGKL